MGIGPRRVEKYGKKVVMWSKIHQNSIRTRMAAPMTAKLNKLYGQTNEHKHIISKYQRNDKLTKRAIRYGRSGLNVE